MCCHVQAFSDDTDGAGGDEVLDDSSRLAQYSLGELAYAEAVLEVVLPPHHFSGPRARGSEGGCGEEGAPHSKRPVALGTSR